MELPASQHPALLGALVLALAAGAFACYCLWRVVAVGAAYKAKVLCSALFVSERRLGDILAEDVAVDSYRIMRLFRARVDRERNTVAVKLLLPRWRVAVYRPGLGATLTAGAAPEDLLPRALPESTAPAVRPWPVRPRAEALERALEAAFTEPNSKRLRRTRAVVVVRDGEIVAERYAPGFGVRTRLCGWSMSKSVFSALVGVLVRDGKLALGDKKLLPEWSSPGDPRGEIKLDDLLRMRSGLKFAEIYLNPLMDVTQMLFAQGDSAAYAAAKPLAAPPGTLWYYSSGTTNILSGIVRRVIGGAPEDYLTFPRRVLFGPIGMQSAVFEPDAAGNFVGSSFFYATARDWARFGLLYAQGGVWEGERLLPEGWVDYAREPTPQSPDGRYGAHWWLKLPPEFGGGAAAAKNLPADAFFALGHEGQTLTVIPSAKLVVVRLGLSVYVDAWDQAEFLLSILNAC